MALRDLFLFAVIFGAVPFILRHPWIGVMFWVWVSVMNPHKLAWGMAFDFQFAYVVAIATLVGIVFTNDERRWKAGPEIYVLIAWVLWMSVTTLFAFSAVEAFEMWTRVVKIQFMTLVSLFVLHSRKHVDLLVWILALSIAFYGIKGGIFTLVQGGEFRVWGPPGGFIQDNNAIALALTMVVPLIFYLFRETPNRWVKGGLFLAMLLCSVSALGTYSRGALLSMAAMGMFLWLRSRRKLVFGLALLAVVPALFALMPAKWEERMRSIGNYEQDSSAMGRINAWWTTFNVAVDRPLVGGGFEMYTPAVFAKYAPNPLDIHSSHSIYFQNLGEHGFVGLFLFLLMWGLTWRCGSWVVRSTARLPEWRWANSLASMIQVSLVGFAVGGLFVNLGYFDLPYFELVVLVLLRDLVKRGVAGATPEAVKAPPDASAQRSDLSAARLPAAGRGPDIRAGANAVGDRARGQSSSNASS